MEGEAALCNKPESWPDDVSREDASEEIVYAVVSAMPIRKRGDGSDEPMAVSLNGDRLGLGEDFPLIASGIAVQRPVICVQYRPVWLGLVLSNFGTTVLDGVLNIGPVQGMQVEVDLPRLVPGETRRVFIMGDEHISTIASDALVIRIWLSIGTHRSFESKAGGQTRA